MSEVAQSISNKMVIKILASLIVPVSVYFLLPVDGKDLTHNMAMFIAITAWAVAIWSLDAINDVAVGMALPVLYMLFCDVPGKVAYAPYGSDVPNSVIGGFILCKVLQDTGLGRRIGLYCMRLMGGSFNGTLWGLLLAVSIVNPLIPAVTGKGIIFAAIVVSLCESLDIKKQSNEATALMLTAFLAVASSKMAYLTGGGDLLITMELADKVMGTKTTWMEYAMWNFLPATLYSIVSVGLVLLLIPNRMDKAELKMAIEQRYNELGSMTRIEKVAGILMLCTLGLLCTDKLHGMSPGMVLILVCLVAFLPKVDVITTDQLKKVNFAPLFFIMGCMAIGSAGGFLKATNWIADNTLQYLEGMSLMGTSLGAYTAGVLGNFLLTPLASSVSLTAPLVELAMQMNLEPRIVLFSFKYGFDNYLFPYEYAVLLLFYSFGYIRFAPMVKVLAVRIVITVPFLAFIAIPFWQWVIG